jgi:hypothetical protein
VTLLSRLRVNLASIFRSRVEVRDLAGQVYGDEYFPHLTLSHHTHTSCTPPFPWVLDSLCASALQTRPEHRYHVSNRLESSRASYDSFTFTSVGLSQFHYINMACLNMLKKCCSYQPELPSSPWKVNISSLLNPILRVKAPID